MLPEFLLQILNNHGDDLQQLALLSYLKSEDKGKPFLEAITAAKVSQCPFQVVDASRLNVLCVILFK